MQLKNMLQFKMSWARASGPYSDVALSSRVRLARNLKSHPFPCRADAEALSAVRNEVFNAAKDTRLKDAARIELEEVTAIDRLFLLERHLISPVLAKQPENRGVLVGEDEELSLMVNEEDHLRLQGIDSGLCLSELAKTVLAADDELSRRLKVAFQPQWGFLTACPTNTGTGMRASVLVHLPALALTGEINRILDGLSRLGIITRGLYGEGTRVMGDFYQISNSTALGLSEIEIVDAITRVVDSLIQKETAARHNLIGGARKLRLEDLVYRALGVLGSARMLAYEESLQHLSYVRMGLTLGWKMPTDINTVNELLVLGQPAHIQMLAAKKLDTGDRDFLRATLFRRKFNKKSKEQP
jgi:protein arginine kinase